MTKNKNDKYKKLALSLVFDGIGYLSYIVPFLGEFSDIFWAPLAGWIMTRLYKGIPGQVAGVIAFVEEIIPGIDIIPTFTLMWLYTYVFKGKTQKSTIKMDS